ncbi:phosphohistidine phosphatase SixA [Thalassotalea sp. HSM 43]|uniref:phosphohistidine phosphatase SixA n=1 Tax=Thalassotalea sp. HSM 43 TaxID=2552945 RepID=UPI00108044F6|nr:phosphohistidine phosphatase SixA [Thalassotalea sp. HSM 43]QBY03330.1 phosphohistidine phosphatase SixA [Thalassotalea sp. HSM 43]
MNVYIMRHGDADTRVQEDKQRPLTETGELEVKVMAKWLGSEGVKFDAIFVSPYKRAQQTAKLLHTLLAADVPLQTFSLITPAGSASEVHDYIDGMLSVERWQNILLVSHMPLVSYLSAEMSTDKSAPIFATASVLHIDYDLQKMHGPIVRHISPDNFC